MKISTKRNSNNKIKKTTIIHRCLIPLILAGLIVIAGCAGSTSIIIPASVPEVRPGILMGYLPFKAAPNSLTLLPAPPARDTAAFAADQEIFRTTRSLMNTPRWKQAIKDAVLQFPQTAEAFSCALDAPITEEITPNIYMLLRRSFTDAAIATFAAKNHYNRTRPFIINKTTSCTPDEEAQLAKDGSYPSGHTTIGWAWTLILAEIAPDRTDALLSRGYAFGQSRVICGVHWQSDVTAGRVLAAGVVAREHADPVFRAQIEAAAKELAAVRAKGLKPKNNCQAEAAALSF
jgi:acid phosphatase (class A)